MSNYSVKQQYKLIQSRFLNEDDNNSKIPISMEMLSSTCSSPPNMNRHIVIDGNTLIFPTGSCIEFYNFFQSNKIFLASVNPQLHEHFDDKNILEEEKNNVEYETVGMAGNGLGKCQVIVASLQKKHRTTLFLSRYSTNDEFVPTICLKFPSETLGDIKSSLKSNLMRIQLMDMLFFTQNYIILVVKTINTEIEYSYKIITISLLGANQSPKAYIKYSTSKYKISRLINLDENIGVVLDSGIGILVNQQFILPQNYLPLQTSIKYRQTEILDYYELENQLKILLFAKTTEKGKKEQYLRCQWAAGSCKTEELRVQDVIESDEVLMSRIENKQSIEIIKMIKVNKHLLLVHKNSVTITHFLVDEDGFKFMANYTYTDYISVMSMESAGIRNIQTSQDEMHIIITVEIVTKSKTIKIENLIFNLSATAGSRKYMNLFTRLATSYPEVGAFKKMESTLSSVSYLLIGSKITSFLYLNSLPSESSSIVTPFTNHQTPKTMTVHPLGYQFVLVFDNMVKFYNKINSVSSINQKVQHNSETLGTIEDTGLELVEVWSEQYNCFSAKYSQSGALALCCLEDSLLKIIIYDSYKFRPIKAIPGVHMHLNGRNTVNRIEWCSGDAAMKIYLGTNNLKTNETQTSTDMIMVNLYNSNRMRQFRQRQSKLSCFKIKYVDYEEESDRLIASVILNIENSDPFKAKVNKELGFEEKHKYFLIYASKEVESHDISLSNHRVIFMPECITYIKICSALKVVFLGGQSGKLYWTQYPLQIYPIDYYSVSAPNSTFFEINPQQLHQLHLNYNQISGMELTGNNKFFIVHIKDNGYFTFKVRRLQNFTNSNRIQKQQNNMNLVFQELGNPIFNTIVTTTITSFSVKKQLLKTLLEKRKSCFSDLDEFRKQFELNHQKMLSQLSKANKVEQLNVVCKELDDIQKLKIQKNIALKQLKQADIYYSKKKQQKINKCEKQLLELYKKQQQQQQTRKQTLQIYEQIFAESSNKCSQNLTEIHSDLHTKYTKFQKTYHLMIKNLRNFQQRILYEKQLHSEEMQEELKNLEYSLKFEEQSIKEQINNLSLSIGGIKKNNQRFGHRKGFLEHKLRHFFQQIRKNSQEYAKLKEIKQELENQLKMLETKTQKKEKVLKNLLNINTSLNKYKEIHEGFIDMGVKEIKQIKDGKEECEEEIKQIMGQLITITQTNSEMRKKISESQTNISKLKKQQIEINNKITKCSHLSQKIAEGINANMEILDMKVKEKKMKEVYENYFLKTNLEVLLEEQVNEYTVNSENQAQDTNEETKKEKKKKFPPKKQQSLKTNQQIPEETQKILRELKDHKAYIINNFKLLQTYNNRIKQEINLNYLRIQSQNYDLISECNTRKDETAKKKKLLHELIDSVKQTQIYLGQMKRDDDQHQKEKQMQTQEEIGEQFGATKNFYRSMTSKTNKNARISTAVRKGTPKIEARFSTGHLLHEKKSNENSQYSLNQISRVKQTPFVIFQRNKYKDSSYQLNSNAKSQVKKILQVKKYQRNDSEQDKKLFRRIQTAKQRYNSPNAAICCLQIDEQIASSHKLIKPKTAKLKDRKQLKSATNTAIKQNKSLSKPTTAQTKSKFSVMI